MHGNLAQTLPVADEPFCIDATQPASLYPRIREHMARLACEVDTVRNSAEFAAVLATMAAFWEYSPFNSWLIRMQMPHATRVAGRRVWEKLGRRIVAGSRPIHIFAPARLTPPFIAVQVYDISQTRGRRLPSFDFALHGSTSAASTLERAASALGIRLRRFESPSGLNGLSSGGVIAIRRHLRGQERAATIAHELAHEILHGLLPRGLTDPCQRETEAEATSYVVLRVLGVPSKAPAYIARHGGDGKLVMQSLKRVQQAAKKILAACRGPRKPPTRQGE